MTPPEVRCEDHGRSAKPIKRLQGSGWRVFAAAYELAFELLFLTSEKTRP
jgi:hypothetical protein